MSLSFFSWHLSYGYLFILYWVLGNSFWVSCILRIFFSNIKFKKFHHVHMCKYYCVLHLSLYGRYFALVYISVVRKQIRNLFKQIFLKFLDFYTETGNCPHVACVDTFRHTAHCNNTPWIYSSKWPFLSTQAGYTNFYYIFHFTTAASHDHWLTGNSCNSLIKSGFITYI